MFTNPDVRKVNIYTVEVTYMDGRHEFYRNVVDLRVTGEGLVLEILAHGIRHVTLTSVNNHSSTLQSTLALDDD